MLLVVVAHVESPYVGHGAGDVGVTIFFTLSGFLISTLLCHELETTGRVSFRRFYERRARRLLPALVTAIAVITVVSTVIGVRLLTWPEALGALFFCTNILRLFIPVEGGGILHHTWSLMIEEQFYVVWPLLSVALWRRRRLLLSVLFIGAAWAAYQRIALIGRDGVDVERLQFSIDTRVDGILIGCALALLLRWKVTTAPTTWGGPGLLCIGVFALSPNQGLTFVVGLTLVSLATAATISSVVAGAAPRWLELGPLRAVGRVSYGLYLWHHIVLVFSYRVLGLGDDWVAVALVMIPTSALLTWLSWRYVEQPFMRRRAVVREVASTTLEGRDASATIPSDGRSTT